MKADEICERYAKMKVGLTVRLLEQDSSEVTNSPTILIEGSMLALKMLAELIVAVSEDDKDAEFAMSPGGAGSIHFSADAELGLYIRRKNPD